jgi:hypothetical protein
MTPMDDDSNDPGDRVIVCIGCGQRFLFTVAGQEFFRTKNYPPPLRCRRCREAARARREGAKR